MKFRVHNITLIGFTITFLNSIRSFHFVLDNFSIKYENLRDYGRLNIGNSSQFVKYLNEMN